MNKDILSKFLKLKMDSSKAGITDNSFDEEQFHIIGFWSPQEAGIHRLRMYFEADRLKLSDEFYLIFVHKETGVFGQDLSWTKLIKVKSEF